MFKLELTEELVIVLKKIVWRALAFNGYQLPAIAATIAYAVENSSRVVSLTDQQLLSFYKFIYNKQTVHILTIEEKSMLLNIKKQIKDRLAIM